MPSAAVHGKGPLRLWRIGYASEGCRVIPGVTPGDRAGFLWTLSCWDGRELGNAGRAENDVWGVGEAGGEGGWVMVEGMGG